MHHVDNRKMNNNPVDVSKEQLAEFFEFDLPYESSDDESSSIDDDFDYTFSRLPTKTNQANPSAANPSAAISPAAISPAPISPAANPRVKPLPTGDNVFSKEGETDEEAAPMLSSGDRATYTITGEAVTVIKVHFDDAPPYYTIRLPSGNERQTSRENLKVPQRPTSQYDTKHAAQKPAAVEPVDPNPPVPNPSTPNPSTLEPVDPIPPAQNPLVEPVPTGDNVTSEEDETDEDEFFDAESDDEDGADAVLTTTQFYI